MKTNRIAVMVGLGLAGFAALAIDGLAQADRAGWPTELVMASVPVEGSKDATERAKPFVAYLEKALNLKIKFTNGADYSAVIIAQQNKQVDFAAYGPGSYIDAAARANVEAFARENSIKNGLGYYSMIISKKDGPIKTFADAKGKNFAWVDPQSTSGYKVPLVYFCKDLKMKAQDYFKTVTFAGTHENVILGVSNGRIEVGATNDLSIVSASEKGVIKGEAEYNILWKSKLIPASPWAVRKDLPASLKAALKKAFTDFNDKTYLESYGLKSYAAAEDADYDAFREVNDYSKRSECK